MDKDHVVSVGLKIADSNIPWPSQAEETLSDRDGWERKTIFVLTAPGQPDHVEAMVKREWAVPRMIGDPGFATTLVPSGFRLHAGGRVWATSEAAMETIERLQILCPDWAKAWNTNYTDRLRITFQSVHEDAEKKRTYLERFGDALRRIKGIY